MARKAKDTVDMEEAHSLRADIFGAPRFDLVRKESSFINAPDHVRIAFAESMSFQGFNADTCQTMWPDFLEANDK